MPEQQNHATHSDEPGGVVSGHFTDRKSAELAAQAALRNGYTVQLVDKSVHVRPEHPEHAGEAEGFLGAYGATNLPDVRATTDALRDSSGAQRVRADQGGSFELVEEELQPQKQPVVGGALLIRKEVVNETVTIDVPVEREELVIERVAIEPRAEDQAAVAESDPLLEALAARLRQMQPGDAVRIPLVEEQVVVHKEAVVKSELVVGKRLVREVQHFQDKVRRQVARVDRRGDIRVSEPEDNA